MTPSDWIDYTKTVDRLVQKRHSEAWAVLSFEEQISVLRHEEELEGFETPVAQKRAVKRSLDRFKRKKGV